MSIPNVLPYVRHELNLLQNNIQKIMTKKKREFKYASQRHLFNLDVIILRMKKFSGKHFGKNGIEQKSLMSDYNEHHVQL